MELKIDEIIRSSRRTISLEITREGRLVIRAPIGAPKKLIEAAVEQKRGWILDKQKSAAARDAVHPPKICAEGETFSLLGENYTLCFDGGAKKITAEDSRLIVPLSIKSNIKNAITEWYKEQAYAVLRQRVGYHASRANVKVGSLKITSALSRWGSCSFDNKQHISGEMLCQSGGKLCFTWRLVMAPLEMIDYVVVHELSHISHPDHSAAFWRRVGELMPDYAVRRDWFRRNSALLRRDFFA